MNDFFKERKCLSLPEIKSYLAEALSDDEIHDIENHLNDCLLCSDAVEGFATMEAADFGKAEKPFPASTAKIKSLPSVAPTKRNAPRRVLFLRAAAAILVMAIPLGIYLYWGESQNQLLYAEFTSDFPNEFDYSRRTSDSSEMKQEPFFRALQLYDKKEYGKSLELLQVHLQDSITDLPAIFFSGVCYLQTGDNDMAIEQLETVIGEPPSGFELDAAWFLALAKLKEGDTERAKRLALMLSKTDSYYKKKAAELLLVLD